MEHVATINVRLPENLKRNGGLVLERSRVSPSELVRSVYRYMERNQAIPACLDIADGEASAAPDPRRALLRSVAGTIPPGGGSGAKDERAMRIEAKYGDLL